MDPTKEASYKSFANQPTNVSSLKLKKIFGTPDAAAAIVLNDRSTGMFCFFMPLMEKN
jgi:hypothetical protein